MVAPNDPPPLVDLIGNLLAEQGRLQTPAARAGVAFDQIENRKSKIENFRSLIPLTAPAPGEQYAFEVNLDKCTGCKACVVACHSLNGLDETESWRDVGLITGFQQDGAAYQQTITTACHHCADPGCMNGCPVLAYEKDPLTGIVRHLDDQCIGCQYCILKCPYDVPKYNKRLGIVRKCDMCHQRLGAGEAPACVQACPTHAIRIVSVSSSPASQLQSSNSNLRTPTSDFLAAAPDGAITLPTTRYVSEREIPTSAAAADAGIARVQPGHTPLAVLLTLSQLALGAQAAALFVTYYVTNTSSFPWGAVALGMLGAALAASVAHLGRPLRAWRVFLGLRRSWLSREAVVFGGWFGALAAAVFTQLPAIEIAAFAIGSVGVFCSAMIYIDTGRRGWSAASVSARFAGTVMLAAGLAVSPIAGLAAAALKLAIDRIALARGPWETRALESGALRFAFRMRSLLGGTGLLLLAAAALGETGAWPVGAAFIVAGELAERILFFRAIDGSKMPGAGAS
ncbi:MAG TPA: DmsC/YnfH family molybdoenzyme membrane anchor subunit [Opitutaceae bacterium]|nr:DmsC/YnfH family molybdoenzyme membrane anchor subunit [Opitutaceae bacterium]